MFLKPCFFEGVAGAICFRSIEMTPWNLSFIEAKLVYFSKSEVKRSQGETKIVQPLPPPAEVSKKSSRAKRAIPGINQATGSKMGTRI